MKELLSLLLLRPAARHELVQVWIVRKAATQRSRAFLANDCFQREAQAASALNHPNICTLYDVGPNYLVTELVEGETLSDLLKRAPSLECCLDIARQVLEALGAAKLLRKKTAERYPSAEATSEALNASAVRASSGTTGTSPQKSVLTGKTRAVNAEAYEAYLKGRYCWERRNEQNLWKSKEYYEQAIEKDPCYAPAWAGLAASYNMLAAYGASPRAETYPRAVVAATRALDLDSKLAEAWATLARVKTEYEWDWDRREGWRAWYPRAKCGATGACHGSFHSCSP